MLHAHRCASDHTSCIVLSHYLLYDIKASRHGAARLRAAAAALRAQQRRAGGEREIRLGRSRAISSDLGQSRAISGDLGRSRVISGDLG